MNIYFLDKDPINCAKYHADRHVLLKTLETAFILSNSHWLSLFYSEDSENCQFNSIKDMKLYFETKYDIDNPKRPPYKMTKINTQHTKWVLESKYNYLWCVSLLKGLTEEFELRYNKVHKIKDFIVWFENNVPTECKDIPLTEFPFTLNEDYYIKNDIVQSYRKFYITEKSETGTWKKEKPDWIK